MPNKQPTNSEIATYLNSSIDVHDECWLWIGPTKTYEKDGQTHHIPVTGLRGYTGRRVRRIAYEVLYPDTDLSGKRVAQGTCDELCIRPDHMLIEQWPKPSQYEQAWTPKAGPFDTLPVGDAARQFRQADGV